jgi:hypothetical protein
MLLIRNGVHVPLLTQPEVAELLSVAFMMMPFAPV